ncbi:hypothetical protein BM525_19440 (plasmid) [Alteromonas mediterranea]|uniref:Uncharacterized protein n=1 Tax=Alteromonas mediterranea TaxID=314275 RepID=A0AAC9NTE4_9ALTE|nr:hypothetical protein [Alteromonas mediterranea]APD92058.1 hypothetical protein BM524_19245 [Alteromonas mediterranea]APD99912.1 hypothetical protein BM525_19440 [Alteromonas mediterranea]
MLSKILRKLPDSVVLDVLAKCKIPSTAEDIKKQFNVSIQFSGNDKGEKLATVDTRRQDSIWWQDNKHKQVLNWRESDVNIYSFTDYSDSPERSLYIAALRAIKPDTCLKYLASLKGEEFKDEILYIQLCHQVGDYLNIDTSDDETNPDYWGLAWHDGLSAHQAVVDSVKPL